MGAKDGLKGSCHQLVTASVSRRCPGLKDVFLCIIESTAQARRRCNYGEKLVWRIFFSYCNSRSVLPTNIKYFEE
jgi:hypothetical protein